MKPITVKRRIERVSRIAEAMVNAEHARCACGCSGSWNHRVYGTSGDTEVVWAGCPNCVGTAIGPPVVATDLAWAERQPEALAAAKRHHEVRRAMLAIDLGGAEIDWSTMRRLDAERHCVEVVMHGDIPVGRVVVRGPDLDVWLVRYV